MAKRLFLSAALLLLSSLSAAADVYIYNTTNERLSYSVALPNGDTKTGEVKENAGYAPAQTTIPSPRGKEAVFRISSESGKSTVEVKGTDSQFFVLVIADGSMRVVPGGWTMNNGQSHKREMTLLNATGEPQTFDIIDEKEIRKGLTLQPGQKETYPATNAFERRWLTVRFASGQRVEKRVGSGDWGIMFLDKRAPNEVRIETFGHVTKPK